jgi:hypothetical protein
MGSRLDVRLCSFGLATRLGRLVEDIFVIVSFFILVVRVPQRSQAI